MSDDLNINDGLLNDDIGRSLRSLGVIFPRTVEDFCKLQLDQSAAKDVLPERIKDPYVFLHRPIVENRARKSVIGVRPDYYQNFAQAAREGREITEEIRNKMAQDRLKSSQGRKNDT